MISFSFVDLLGHLAYGAVVGGQMLIARNKWAGWPIRAVSELVLAGIGFYTEQSHIALWCLVFFCVDIQGAMRNRKG